jgi:dTDP-4-dehydrorhamnose reductase
LKKKIFITGGSGLLAINWAIWGSSKYIIILGINKKIIKINGIKTIKVNFSTIEATELTLKKIEPDIIINTIGLTNVDYCEQEPSFSQIANETIPSYIAKISRKYKITLVHISTDHLFDGRYSLVSESQVPKPLNQYAKSKAKGEILVAKSCPKSLIIRTNFFGWGPIYRQSFSDFIIYNLRKKNKITLFQDIYFSPILIENLVLYIYELIERNLYGIFNIVSDERLSKYEFGVKIAKKFNLDVSLIEMGSIKDSNNLVTRPKDMSLSNKKLSKILNRPIGSIDDQIDLLFEQEKYFLRYPITVL